MEKASDHLYAHCISSNVEQKLTKYNPVWSELSSDRPKYYIKNTGWISTLPHNYKTI